MNHPNQNVLNQNLRADPPNHATVRPTSNTAKGRPLAWDLFGVAQIFNLPYRRIASCGTSSRLEMVDRADALPIANRRYGRVQLCATTQGSLSMSLGCALAGLLFGLAIPSGVWAAENEAPPGFVALFNGKDFSGWKVPEGDGGHWKIVAGAIDYDAESEAKGDKNLWSEREFGDFVLRVDWRIKETPYVNPNVPYILPDGTHARDVHGKEIKMALPDSDSGIFLRGSGRYQLNIFCWPIGSGEMYGLRMDRNASPELRAAVTPRTQADKPVGEWNRFEITVRGNTVNVLLNGKTVIPHAEIPGLPARGRIALQHHGAKREGKWTGPPSLVQFKNVFVKELDK